MKKRTIIFAALTINLSLHATGPEDIGWAYIHTDVFHDGVQSYFKWNKVNAQGTVYQDGKFRISPDTGIIYNLNDCSYDESATEPGTDTRVIINPRSESYKGLIVQSAPFDINAVTVTTHSSCPTDALMYLHFGATDCNNTDYIRVALTTPEAAYHVIGQERETPAPVTVRKIAFEGNNIPVTSISYLSAKPDSLERVATISDFLAGESLTVTAIDENALVIGQHGNTLWVKGMTSGAHLRIEVDTPYDDLVGWQLRGGFGGRRKFSAGRIVMRGEKYLFCPSRYSSKTDKREEILPEPVTIADIDDSMLDQYVRIGGATLADGMAADSSGELPATGAPGFIMQPMYCDIEGFVSIDDNKSLCLTVTSQTPRAKADGEIYDLTSPDTFGANPALSDYTGEYWPLAQKQQFRLSETALTFESEQLQTLRADRGVSCSNAILRIEQATGGDGITGVEIIAGNDGASVSQELSGIGIVTSDGNTHTWSAATSRSEADNSITSLAFSVSGDIRNVTVSYNTSRIPTDIPAVSIDPDADALPVYFNVHGIKVTVPGKGIYIERRGKAVRKVIIR